jgi:hypothetical protein
LNTPLPIVAAAALLACVPVGGVAWGDAAPPALVSDFRTVCVETKADPDVAEAAAERIGAWPTDDPRQRGQRKGGRAGQDGWVHVAAGRAIYLSIALGDPRRPRGASCAAYDFEDDVAALAAVRDLREALAPESLFFFTVTAWARSTNLYVARTDRPRPPATVSRADTWWRPVLISSRRLGSARTPG